MLGIGFSLNLLLCIFNLLPIPPLDGSSLPLILPHRLAVQCFDALRSPMIQTIGFIIIYRASMSRLASLMDHVASIFYCGMHSY